MSSCGWHSSSNSSDKFRELPGRLEFAISKPGKTVQDVEKLLQEIVESRSVKLFDLQMIKILSDPPLFLEEKVSY